MAVAGMSGSGIWSSGCGGCIVGECITIALLAVFGLRQSTRPVHSSASVAGLMAWSNGASASGRHLRISGAADLVASPEWRATSTRCVVICWRRAVALLLLMMSDEEDLEKGCDDEEENIDDCDGEDSCLEATSLT